MRDGCDDVSLFHPAIEAAASLGDCGLPRLTQVLHQRLSRACQRAAPQQRWMCPS